MTHDAVEYVYLNGEILPAGEAAVSAFDAGFAHAAGLFETLRAYNGRVMRGREHLRRLTNSAAVLGMQIALDEDALAKGINDLLVAMNLREARLRIVATPGPLPRGGQAAASVPRPTTFITAEPVRPYPPELYAGGMRVCICPCRQNPYDPLAGHKTLAYLPRLMALREAAGRQCHEALWFTTHDRLAEGCICNVFLVDDDGVKTPPLDTPILPGTTRGAVLELCRENGIAAGETPLDVHRLMAAKEIFLTGSVLEIMPVTSVEKHIVGAGVPGPTTRRIASLYRELVAKECGLG